MVISQEDSKFAHLLEPIRDLAANWDVNIADELEDYLVRSRCKRVASRISITFLNKCDKLIVVNPPQEVLEAVKFSFEDGPSLNFAEGVVLSQCPCPCPPA